LYPLWSTFVDAYYTEYNLLSQHWYHCFIGTEKDLSLEWWCVFFWMRTYWCN
jgi:hypothetical protein